MSSIRFDQGTYTITWGGQFIKLLPKEFALLKYMFQYSNQTLTRDQLLDGVWSMESPVDRTVDDHIYRLRKKLIPWSPTYRIETVRGFGYRFIANSKPQENPLLYNRSFSQEIQNIVKTYLKFGRGDALLALFRNKEIFGLELDSFFQIIIQSMEGDVRFLVENQSIPFHERAFQLLYLYQQINPKENRGYVECILRSRILPPLFQNELENIVYASMLMDWGEFEQAKLSLEALSAQVRQNGWDGLVPYVNNQWIKHDLYILDSESLQFHLKLAEEELQQYPYQREEGQFYILKGIALYRLYPREGLPWIERGIDILKRSQFLPHLLHGLRTILSFSECFAWGELSGTYEYEWKQLCSRVGLDEIKDNMSQQLQNFCENL